MHCHSTLQKNKLDKLSITGRTWGFNARLPITQCRREAINVYLRVFLGDSDSVGATLQLPAGMYGMV